MIRPGATLPWLLGALAMAAGGAAVASKAPGDQRFLAGLRQRGLFQLAETYCLGKLGETALPDTRRAELVVELSLTLADWAVNSPPDERPPLWDRAWRVADEFAQERPADPRLPLVRFQAALGLVARGELARQESELVADNQPLVEEARTHLRAAIRQIEALTEEVVERLRAAGMPGRSAAASNNSGELTEYELAALQKNVAYQLARALRNQGQCYPADSPDRANSLTRAIALLDPLARLEAEHPLAFKSRLDEIVCHRLLAHYATATRKLDALAAENPPAAVALHARGERIRLALAAGALDRALELTAAGRTFDGAVSAELDFAALEAYLEAWRAASRSDDQPNASRWQSKATGLVRLIEEQHGAYWTRRAEMLLAGYVRTSPDASGLDMQVRAAESSFRSGRPDDAVAAYDRARAMAQEQGDAASAFELGYTAAAIVHQENRHGEALTRYRNLALDHSGNTKAPEAHVLAIYHAEQLARAQPADGIRPYVELLQEHLAHWSGGPTADEVRWRLGRLREHQRDWQNAIAAYRGISPEFKAFDEVVEAAARSYHAWLDERAAGGQPTGEIAADAAGWFESIVLGHQQRLPQAWTTRARTAALEAARLWLNYTSSGYGRAEQILSAALEHPEDAPPEWKSAARAMLVFSLAGQGRRHEAAEILRQISSGPPDQLLGMLEGLLRVVAAASPPAKAEWAELALAAVALLDGRRGELDRQDQHSLDRLKAQALAEAGRTDEALAAYQWLAKIYPRDGDVQEACARLLSTRQDRGSLEAALAKWREVEDGSRPAGDRWFRAKYEVALLHYRLGNRRQTEKMIRLLAVLHPELGGSEMKARFQELLARAAYKPEAQAR